MLSPIAVYKDGSVEEYVPDITDPQSMRLGEFHACGTYTVSLYVYEKSSEGVTRYYVFVDTQTQYVTVSRGPWVQAKPERMQLSVAPIRIRAAVSRITEILTKEVGHPSPEQRLNWDGAEKFCAKASDSPPAVIKDEPANLQRIGGSVKPPVLIYKADSQFPPEARQDMLSGKVEVHLIVDKNGLPTHVSVPKPIGHGFDEEAISAVRQYRFRPATKDGDPVPVEIYVDVNFTILPNQ